MRLGFVSAILPDLSLEEVLRFAAEEGFSSVELMCWPKGKAERRYAGVTHLDAAGFGEEEAKRLKDLVATSGIAVSGLGYYPNPLAPDREESKVYASGSTPRSSPAWGMSTGADCSRSSGTPASAATWPSRWRTDPTRVRSSGGRPPSARAGGSSGSSSRKGIEGGPGRWTTPTATSRR